ncbi:MAG TPA: thiamine pyrophosphate-dependent enzyme [Acetobacteraceae bacterium]|nr:thiamine pyrophosphate-dependent enzyme [Acetobacteraceae bacterium]
MRDPSRRLSTAEAAIETLLAHGIDTLYALPGVHNDPLFDAAHAAQPRLRVLHARHEQTAAYMALGAALATGRPQPYCVVPGPGVLNSSAALLTAYGMGAPVVALAGQIPSFAIDRGHGHLHELSDQLGLLRHITKRAERIEAPHEAGPKLAEAIRASVSGRPGPVALECAIDVWGRRGPAATPGPLPREVPPLDPEAVERAADILAKAERPLILAGGGALDAAPALARVAELLGAPVATFRRGRGAVPTTHPLAVSFTEGHRFWAEADVVLAVGTRAYIQQSVWGLDHRLKLIRIDIDPAEPDRFRHASCAIVADARPALEALAEAIEARGREGTGWGAALDANRAWFAEKLEAMQPQLGFMRAIRAALPEDGIYVEDVTQIGFISRLAWPVAQPRLYLSPGHQDNLGWAYGAALGAQAAMPGRKVVAVCGDGGFMYQAQELATAMHHKLPVVAVVFDDGAFGNVRRIQEERFGSRLIASDLTNPDFVAFALSFGAGGYRAETPEALEAALREAFARDEPAIVQVPVGAMPSPWGLIALPRVRGREEPKRPALP